MKAASLAEVEAAIEELLDRLEGEVTTLTALAEIMLELRKRLGQRMGSVIIERQEATRPVERPRCLTCGQEMSYKGMKGDADTFADALSLVRYRTSDLIGVVSTAPCACGRTHPRMHALHRTDDIVNLGVVRFSIFALRHKLAQVDGIARWQLRVTRHDFKPKAVLVVEPAEGRGNGQLMKEILSAALQWEPIRLGCDHSLIARPEVRLMDSLQEGRTSSGQLRHLTYEDM